MFAMLVFQSFHAGSGLIPDLKRAGDETLPRLVFGHRDGVQKRGDTRFHGLSNTLRPPALSGPQARDCCVSVGFIPARCLPVLLVLLVALVLLALLEIIELL